MANWFSAFFGPLQNGEKREIPPHLPVLSVCRCLVSVSVCVCLSLTHTHDTHTISVPQGGQAAAARASTIQDLLKRGWIASLWRHEMAKKEEKIL